MNRVFGDDSVIPDGRQLLNWRHPDSTFPVRILPQMDPSESFRLSHQFQNRFILGASQYRSTQLRRTSVSAIDQVHREAPTRNGKRFLLPLRPVVFIESSAEDSASDVIVGQQPPDGPFEYYSQEIFSKENYVYRFFKWVVMSWKPSVIKMYGTK